MSLTQTFFTAFLADLKETLSLDVRSAQDVVRCLQFDLNYVSERIQNEGETFVVSQLSQLGKAIDISLVTEEPLHVPEGFNLLGKSRLPALFNCLFKEVFNDNGVPMYKFDQQSYTNYCVSMRGGLDFVPIRTVAYYVQLLRQLTLAFSKVEDVPSMMLPSDAACAFKARITTKREITLDRRTIWATRKLLHDVLMDGTELNARLAQWVENPFGKHGPGAVAGREKGSDKWDFDEIFGCDARLYEWRAECPTSRKSRADVLTRTSRMQVVPKDFRSLRIICIEPKELQFAQQGLWKVLEGCVRAHPISSKEINFRRQELSQALCLDRELATIDLKDASDTLSIALGRILLPKKAFELLTRYRSSHIRLPDGEIIKNESLATMGSSLCFPLETLVFWALVRTTVNYSAFLNGEHFCKSHSMKVRVFGDDIICPLWAYDDVTDVLSKCGFVINRAKSCSRTLVRESCGAWYWCGYDASVVKLHYRTCTSARAWVSLVESAQLLLRRLDYSYPTEVVKSICAACNEWYLANAKRKGQPTSLFEGGLVTYRRYNKALHRAEAWVPFLRQGSGKSALSGYAGLYASIVGGDTDPRPFGTDKVKWGWRSLADVASVS